MTYRDLPPLGLGLDRGDGGWDERRSLPVKRPSARASAPAFEPEPELLDFVNRTSRDPLAFVREAYPWGEGELAGFTGPRDWQAEVLGEIGAQLEARRGRVTPVTRHDHDRAIGVARPQRRDIPIRVAVASGHGVGKSALVAWLAQWGLATFAGSRVMLTANTGQQLTTKTWPELVKWHNRLVCRHWFQLGATSVRGLASSLRDTWRIDRVTWSDHNTEAFAGLHNLGRRIVVLYDEASTISDRIWEVTEGALTDTGTEIVWVAFGNPTRSTGRFRECFGKHRALWTGRQIDSRDVEGANTALSAQWVETYGEDSDFVRVRVRGQFPRTGSLQFIGEELVDAAVARELVPLPGYNRAQPLVLGVDVARFGDDRTVIQPRRGLDARALPALVLRGRDTMEVAASVLDMAQAYGAEAVFVDEGGIGAGVVDRLRQLRCPGLVGVNFASRADGWSEGVDGRGSNFANKRAEMWGRMKEWLRTGVLPDTQAGAELRADLTGVEYGYNVRDELLLESKDSLKARGLASPDLADALALTFAHPVAPVAAAYSAPAYSPSAGDTYWPAPATPRAPIMLPDNWEPYQDDD